MPLDESEDLLNQIWAHVIQPQFVWAQEWEMGDMVMWDNRCAMHRRDSFDPNSIRLMHRTAIRANARCCRSRPRSPLPGSRHRGWCGTSS